DFYEANNYDDIYYYHPDHLGSSSYISNAEGTVSQHMEYLPFGETLVDEHLNSYNTPFKFNGKEYDDETGNYYYGARYYDPKLSIFISVDPLAEKYSGWSSYAYAFNNPIRFIDPTGMEGDDIIDIDKYTGYTTVTKAKGDDVVRIIDSKNNNEVVDSYTYGENGSFDKDTRIDIERGPIGNQNLGQRIHFNTDTEKASKFYEFAAQTDVEFGLLDIFYGNSSYGETVVMTDYSSWSVASSDYASGVLRENEDATVTRSSHSHPGSFNAKTFWPAAPSGFNQKTLHPNNKGGDRDVYISNKNEFGDRMPKYHEVYYAKGPKFNIMYNGEKAIRTPK
ncbi:RHS repeat-associated core domain-containing protein, partial [Flavobacterium sp. MK4S-17]|uniref:RHS repeat-associated core domain-containing protein n=1 Tax=Flavobacterium sp. MK4S-17 TaxID=2543737 RepID=UPI0019154380